MLYLSISTCALSIGDSYKLGNLLLIFPHNQLNFIHYDGRHIFAQNYPSVLADNNLEYNADDQSLIAFGKDYFLKYIDP